MFSPFKKNKLKEEQIDKFGKAGETLGKKIRQSSYFQNFYNKANDFGTRHTLFVVILMLSLCCFSFGLQIYGIFQRKNSRTSVPSEQLENTLPKISTYSNYDDSIRIAKDGIERIFIEAKDISDSIQRILAKPNPTHEDSIYVITQGKYLEKLTNALKK